MIGVLAQGLQQPGNLELDVFGAPSLQSLVELGGLTEEA